MKWIFQLTDSGAKEEHEPYYAKLPPGIEEYGTPPNPPPAIG
jgi:hypothetical protein